MEKTIDAGQLMASLALLRISTIMVFLPVATMAGALHDAWLSVILSTLGGLALGSMFAVLAMRFPDQTFGAFSKEVLGKVLGTLAGLSLGLFFFASAVLGSRLIAFLIVTTVLESSPGWAISLPMLAIGVYAAVLGSDTLGRFAVVVLAVVLGLIGISLMVLYASARPDPSFLKPVLSKGFAPVLKATITPIFWFAATSSTCLALTKFCREPQKTLGAVTKSTLLSGSILLAITVTSTAILGPIKTQDQLIPVLSLARTVFLMGVVERLDLVLLTIWVPVVAFDVALSLFSSSAIIAEAVGAKQSKVTYILAGMAVLPVSLRYVSFFNTMEALSIVPVGTATLVIHMGLVGLVLLVAIIRGKGRKGGV